MPGAGEPAQCRYGIATAPGERVAQISSARMNEVCAVLRFSLGCDAGYLVGTFRLAPEFPPRASLYCQAASSATTSTRWVQGTGRI